MELASSIFFTMQRCACEGHFADGECNRSAALNHWKGKVQEEKELSFKGHKIVLRWKMKYLSIALEKIKIHCNEMKRTRLVLARMLNQALSGAFYT